MNKKEGGVRINYMRKDLDEIVRDFINEYGFAFDEDGRALVMVPLLIPLDTYIKYLRERGENYVVRRGD